MKVFKDNKSVFTAYYSIPAGFKKYRFFSDKKAPFLLAMFFLISGVLNAFFIYSPSPLFAEVSLVDEQDSFYWYQEAKYYSINRKDYEKALRYCENSLKLNPDNIQARELKTWLVYRLNQLEEIKRQKELRARQLLEAKEPVDAKKGTDETEVKTSSGTDSGSAAVSDGPIDNLNYYQGLTALTEGRFEEARDFFKNDIIDNPRRIESWFYLFKYEKDNGNETGALYYLRKIKEKIVECGSDKVDLEFMTTLKRQCSLYQDEAILQKGVYRYNLAIDIGNEIKGNYDWKAISIIPSTSSIFIEKKLMAFADIDKLKRSGDIPGNFKTPSDNFSVDLNGRIIASKQSFKKASRIEIPVLTRNAAEKIRGDIERLISQGDYYAYIGIYERALAFYNEALSRAPHSPVANNNKGVMLRAKGHFDEAAEYFKKAIAYDRTYVEAYNNLATVYSRRGNDEEALKLYLAASKLNPFEAGIYYNIGVLYHKNGELDKAREYIGRAVAINDADPSYFYQLGLIDLKKNNRKSAYLNFQKVSKMVARDSEVYLKVRELIQTLSKE